MAELVALADPNPIRMAVHNARVVEMGGTPVPTYRADDFAGMLDKERVDVAVITTVDRYPRRLHRRRARGRPRRAHREADDRRRGPRCRRILDAVARTGGRVRVTFNYRYNPVHEAVKRVLAAGEIGEIGSVHFEWLLDVRHGADYFRRWHRDKANSGGLLVHKASHHFDLVNWWLARQPGAGARLRAAVLLRRRGRRAARLRPRLRAGARLPRRGRTTRSHCRL